MRWRARPAASSPTSRSAPSCPASAPAKRRRRLIRKQFAGDIRQQVLENLIPEVPAEAGRGREPERGGHARYQRRPFPRWRAAAIQGDIRSRARRSNWASTQDVEVPYQDPEVTDEDIAKRIDEIREQKAQYVNIDPRPVEDGDFAVVSLESLAGVEGEPVKTGRDGAGDRRQGHLRGVHRESARPHPGRREGIRSHLSGGLRRRAAGRQDREVPRRR